VPLARHLSASALPSPPRLKLCPLPQWWPAVSSNAASWLCQSRDPVRRFVIHCQSNQVSGHHHHNLAVAPAAQAKCRSTFMHMHARAWTCAPASQPASQPARAAALLLISQWWRQQQQQSSRPQLQNTLQPHLMLQSHPTQASKQAGGQRVAQLHDLRALGYTQYKRSSLGAALELAGSRRRPRLAA
jgi:hypothetical protein